MRKLIACLAVAFFIISWVGASHAYKSGKGKRAKLSELKARREAKEETERIPVYANDKAGKPYVVIGKLSFEKGSNIGRCEERLGKYAAKKHDADAILNYRLIQLHFCEGVAVRWAEPGEASITDITEDTAVPVIDGKKVTFRWF
jgi:hypothetical protein